MIQSSNRLSDLFETGQSKEGGNATLHQERKDGRGSLVLRWCHLLSRTRTGLVVASF
jgi:hypothetical protein